MSAAALPSCKLRSAPAYDQNVNTLLCLAPNQKLFQIVFPPKFVLLFDVLALIPNRSGSRMLSYGRILTGNTVWINDLG